MTRSAEQKTLLTRSDGNRTEDESHTTELCCSRCGVPLIEDLERSFRGDGYTVRYCVRYCMQCARTEQVEHVLSET